MHHNLTPSINGKKYQEKNINNFCTSAYLPSANTSTTFDWSQAHLSQDSLPYTSRMNLTDHTGGDFAGLENAIPDFETFLRNNFGGEKREKKKVSQCKFVQNEKKLSSEEQKEKVSSLKSVHSESLH